LLAPSSLTHLYTDVDAFSSMSSLASWWLKVLFMEIPLKTEEPDFLFQIYSYYIQCLTGVLVLTHQNLHQNF
jgi:hypothetical protein